MSGLDTQTHTHTHSTTTVTLAAHARRGLITTFTVWLRYVTLYTRMRFLCCRGYGLFIGVELTEGAGSKVPNSKLAEDIIKR